MRQLRRSDSKTRSDQDLIGMPTTVVMQEEDQPWIQFSGRTPVLIVVLQKLTIEKSQVA
jgi:hypothetical protein